MDMYGEKLNVLDTEKKIHRIIEGITVKTLIRAALK